MIEGQSKSAALKKRNRFFSKYKNEITAYKLLAVPLLFWGVFFVFAFARALVMSFTDWQFFNEPLFIGLDNYIRIFSDEIVRKAFVNTTIWMVVMLVGNNVMGTLVAYLLINLKKYQKFFLALLFWPTLVSAAVGAELQKFIFDPTENGLLNIIIMRFPGVEEPVPWLTDPDIALFSLMMLPFLLGFGTKMLIYYAGMKNIPSQIYEAALFETNSKFIIFKTITLPLLKPIIMLNCVLSIIEGFKVIAPMQLITFGGPLDSTMSVVLSLYNYGFAEQEMGYASAISMVLFVIIMIVTYIQLKMEGDKVSYE